MKQEWIARAKRFATYALVGCFDTGMDWVAFTTAHELLHFTPLICQAIGYIVGTVCSYFLNGRITFRDGHIARWRQCLRFVVWNVVVRIKTVATMVTGMVAWMVFVATR